MPGDYGHWGDWIELAAGLLMYLVAAIVRHDWRLDEEGRRKRAERKELKRRWAQRHEGSQDDDPPPTA